MSWLGVKEARFLLKGQERLGGIEKDVLRMHRYGAGENSPKKTAAVDSHTSPKTAREVYFRKKNTKTAQLPRLSAIGYK